MLRPLTRKFSGFLPRVYYLFIFVILLTLLNFYAPFSSWHPAAVLNNEHAGDPSCDALQGLDDLFVALRTGANEAPRKLPAHFATTLRCVRNYGLWSDLEEDIAGHHVYDVLDDMDPGIVAEHPDFAYYRQLKSNGRDSFTQDELTKWSTAKNSASGRDTPGWRLDKWKFLPLADKAYRTKPDAKWYIIMECDSFVIWPNLLAWLAMMDSSKPLYLGHQMQIGDVVFAYGGAGIVISNTAMKALVERWRGNLESYDKFTGGHWAGDCVLGKAMLDAGVPLSYSTPTLFGDMVADKNVNDTFGSSNRPLWCYFATTYHHMTPAGIAEYDAFERHWRKDVRFARGPFESVDPVLTSCSTITPFCGTATSSPTSCSRS